MGGRIVPLGNLSSGNPSSLPPFFVTTKTGPSFALPGEDGDKAFSYSEIRWYDGFDPV